MRNLIISTLLIISVALSSWSIFVSNRTPLISHPKSERLPDAFMEDIVALILNKQGTPALKVVAPKMVHYSNDDATEIQNPIVTIYHHSPNPWKIHSDFAKTVQGISQILFWSHVVIHHLQDQENPTTTMQTTALTVFPDKQVAETDQPVTILQPDSTVEAVGMTADINDGTIKLLSKAKGEYVPTS
jgi:lipopolysaccharide export system protein LptC